MAIRARRTGQDAALFDAVEVTTANVQDEAELAAVLPPAPAGDVYGDSAFARQQLRAPDRLARRPATHGAKRRFWADRRRWYACWSTILKHGMGCAPASGRMEGCARIESNGARRQRERMDRFSYAWRFSEKV